MSIRVERSVATVPDSVMYSVERAKRGNGAPRRQEIRLAWPLRGLIDPRKDIPRELAFNRINIRVTPQLALPENRRLLEEMVFAFKVGGIVVESGPDRSERQRDTWRNIARELAAHDVNSQIDLHFCVKHDGAPYLDIVAPSVYAGGRRLFLGNL